MMATWLMTWVGLRLSVWERLDLSAEIPTRREMYESSRVKTYGTDGAVRASRHACAWQLHA